MQDEMVGHGPQSEFVPTRRWFGKAIVAGAALAALPVAPAAFASSNMQVFAIDAAPGVFVRVGSGATFTVTVVDAKGAVIEGFDGVTSANVTRLASPHFTVRPVRPPVALAS